MASVLKKLFKSCDRHHSGEAGGGARRRKKPTDSPVHNRHRHQSAAMRFFGHCSSPRREKVCPEDGAIAHTVNSTEGHHDASTLSSSSKGSSNNNHSNSPSLSVRFKSSKLSKHSGATKSSENSSSVHGQTVRARRLMKEYQEIIKRSKNLEKPPFVVDLVDENLFEWNVKLYQIDPESEFYNDMQEAEIDHVLLNIVFPDNFPFSPPFMRVISPHVEKGFVMEGGAICMELLTPRGWASAYTVEAVVMQFAASLVKGQGRIARKCKSGKEFSRKSAEASFRSLVKTHEKYGWVTPPLADG